MNLQVVVDTLAYPRYMTVDFNFVWPDTSKTYKFEEHRELGKRPSWRPEFAKPYTHLLFQITHHLFRLQHLHIPLSREDL